MTTMIPEVPFGAGRLFCCRGGATSIVSEKNCTLILTGSPERSSRIPTSARPVLASIASSSRDRFGWISDPSN
jgi:hypothetical protein